VENSLPYFQALRKQGVIAEMHIYQNGPHGVGLAPDDPVLFTWKDRLQDWLMVNCLLSDRPRANVKGSVRVDGQPLDRGSLTLIPAGASANLPIPRQTASIVKGMYEFPPEARPVAGEYSVHLSPNRLTPNEPSQRNRSYPDLSLKIVEGDNIMDFDLRSEKIRTQSNK
jgi:hypothetical protein